MTPPPLISIVVPSFNQGAFIAETLQSLLDQDYPRLEVIVQDGGSTDQAITIAREFARCHPSTFQVFVERDSGQADALNRGFARTQGDILGFLNSDDTLYPGCLHRVAEEINPARGRHIVFGRCLFTGENSPHVGVEHPSVYISHFEQLAIWKRGYNTLPQPSVFWHRRVWERCGGLNAQEQHVLDYDLFCRFSAKYRFHFIDELWSTYRLHPASKSSQRADAEVLDMSIATSRRYWGAWWCPRRWRCEISYWLHNRHLQERARHHARQAEAAAAKKHRLLAFGKFLQTAVYSPHMARDRLLHAWLASWKLRFLEKLLTFDEGFAGRHADGWIGPVYRTSLAVPSDARKIVVVLNHVPQKHHQTIRCVLRINRQKLGDLKTDKAGHLVLEGDLTGAPRTPSLTIEILTDSFFIPSNLDNTSGDHRKLSLQLLTTQIQ